MKTMIIKQTIEASELNGNLIIKVLVEELGLTETPTLAEDVNKAINNYNAKLMIVDLSNVHYLDSMGVTFLIMLKKRLNAAESDMVVVCNKSSILQVFKLLHIEKYLQVYPSVDSACNLGPEIRCA